MPHCDSYMLLLAQCKKENDVILTDFFLVCSVKYFILLKVTSSGLKQTQANSCQISGLMWLCSYLGKEKVYGFKMAQQINK